MPMPSYSLSETIHTGAWIISEADGYRSRDTISISNAAPLLTGTVLAMPGNPAAETATVTPAADNTGNGALTMATSGPLTAAAVDGAYTVELTGATTFNVLDPRGRIIDKGSVGASFAGPVNFLLNAGTTPFAADDRFTINVLRPIDAGDVPTPLAPDGSTEAAGILFTTVRAANPAGTERAVMLSRDCEARASDLTWPAGFTPAQIAEATRQLARRKIILR